MLPAATRAALTCLFFGLNDWEGQQLQRGGRASSSSGALTKEHMDALSQLAINEGAAAAAAFEILTDRRQVEI